MRWGAQGGQGGGGGGFNPLGGMGGQMDFMKNKAKFQEDPDTGITFDDVAVSRRLCLSWVPDCCGAGRHVPLGGRRRGRPGAGPRIAEQRMVFCTPGAWRLTAVAAWTARACVSRVVLTLILRSMRIGTLRTLANSGAWRL